MRVDGCSLRLKNVDLSELDLSWANFRAAEFFEPNFRPWVWRRCV